MNDPWRTGEVADALEAFSRKENAADLGFRSAGATGFPGPRPCGPIVSLSETRDEYAQHVNERWQP